MTYVIEEPCLDVKDHACVDVCPVDCIHPRQDEDKGERMLYINPEECIDCGACVPACPVQAIFPEDELKEDKKFYKEMNADYFKLSPEDFENKWKRKP